MKKLMCILAVATFVLGLMVASEAATSATVSATAAVTSELELTASVFRVDSKDTDTDTDDVWDTTPSTSMAFGNLTHKLADGSEAGLLFSRPYYYVALLGGFTSGRRYMIRQTCSGLTGTGGTITAGFGITYLDGDPKEADGTSINPNAMVGTLGTPGTAVAPAKVLFDSGSTGASRVIAAYYGIPPYKSDGSAPFPGHTPISLDIAGGTYSGNVQFSLVQY